VQAPTCSFAIFVEAVAADLSGIVSIAGILFLLP
jgi:hypothetical protein